MKVFLTIHECAELDKRVASQLNSDGVAAAMRTKQSVVDALAAVTSRDKLGFAKLLLMKARQRLDDLRKLSQGGYNRGYVQKALYQDAGTFIEFQLPFTSNSSLSFQ